MGWRLSWTKHKTIPDSRWLYVLGTGGDRVIWKKDFSGVGLESVFLVLILRWPFIGGSSLPYLSLWLFMLCNIQSMLSMYFIFVKFSRGVRVHYSNRLYKCEYFILEGRNDTVEIKLVQHDLSKIKYNKVKNWTKVILYLTLGFWALPLYCFIY